MKKAQVKQKKLKSGKIYDKINNHTFGSIRVEGFIH